MTISEYSPTWMSGGMFECWAGQGTIPHFGQVACTPWNTRCSWPHLWSACGQGWCLKYLPTRVAWIYQSSQPAWQTGLPRWKWKLLSHVRLCNPMDCILHGILQTRILEWVAITFSRGSSQPRESNPGLLHRTRILYQLSHVKNLPANAGDRGLIPHGAEQVRPEATTVGPVL